MQIEGLTRRALSGGRVGLNHQQQMGLDFVAAQMVDQVLPPKGLRAAAGCRFNAVVGNGATFIAPVVAYPTTTATFLLFNGEEPGTGKSYFVDSLYAFLASGTSGAGGALLAGLTLSQQKAAGVLPASYAGVVISSLSGQANRSKAALANAWTIVGGTPAWQVVAKSEAAAAATIGANVLLADIQGGIVIPPQYGLALTVLSGAGTTPLFGFGATWDEIQADLE